MKKQITQEKGFRFLGKASLLLALFLTGASTLKAQTTTYYFADTHAISGAATIWDLSSSTPTGGADDTTNVNLLVGALGAYPFIPGVDNNAILSVLSGFSGGGWETPALTGTLPSGNIRFNMKIANAGLVSAVGSLQARLLAGSNTNGSNAVTLSNWILSPDLLTLLANQTQTDSFQVALASPVALNNQHLFVQVAWDCTVSAAFGVTFVTNESAESMVIPSIQAFTSTPTMPASTATATYTFTADPATSTSTYTATSIPPSSTPTIPASTATPTYTFTTAPATSTSTYTDTSVPPSSTPTMPASTATPTYTFTTAPATSTSTYTSTTGSTATYTYTPSGPTSTPTHTPTVSGSTSTATSTATPPASTATFTPTVPAATPTYTSTTVSNPGTNSSVSTAGGGYPTSYTPDGVFGANHNSFDPALNGVTLYYQVPQPCEVKMALYNVMGLPVRQLMDETLPAGVWSVEWNGTNDAGSMVASDVYFVLLKIGNSTYVRKIAVVRRTK